MAGVVFDASAVIAAVLGEPGGDAVFDRIDAAVVGAVNVAEVYTYAAMNALPTEAFDAFFAETGVEIVPFGHEQAIAAGKLAQVTRKSGLSLGDRACLVLAMLRDADAVTADRSWQQLAADAGVTVVLLR